MLDITLQNLAKILGGRFRGSSDAKASGITIDSRQVKEGDLFIALPGEKVDGHKYIDDAMAKGAIGAVVSNLKLVSYPEDKNLIICQDTLKFLQDMAKLIRQNTKIPVVAITGSTGKTTTKDLIFSILSQTYYCLKTEGNFNNELGLPLTLSRLNNHEAIVLEMGMRGLGQISFLCELAKPTLGVITNIGQVHAEILGSQKKIAQAKAELLKYIPAEGTAILNVNDRELLKPWMKDCKGKVLWFGIDEEADISAKNIEYLGEQGSKFTVIYNQESIDDVTINIPGEHNILNALASIGIAKTLGIGWNHIKDGLSQVKLTSMRLEVLETNQGVKILNDTYNANPTSMAAALKTLAQFSGLRKIAVLGDMYELGVYEEEGHKLMGKIAFEQKVDLLIAVGKLGQLIGRGAIEAGANSDMVVFATDNKEAESILRKFLHKGDTVLIKGSRGMQMEEIVEGLMG